MTNIGGAAQVTYDGVTYNTDGEWDVEINQSKAEAKRASNGVIVTTEVPQISKATGKIFVDSQTDVASIIAARDVTVTIVSPTGRAVSFVNANFTGDGKYSFKDGVLEVEIQGNAQYV